MIRVAIVTPTIGEDLTKTIESVDAQRLPKGVELHHVIVRDGITTSITARGDVDAVAVLDDLKRNSSMVLPAGMQLEIIPPSRSEVTGNRHWLALPGDPNGLGCGAVPRAFGSLYAVDRLRVHALGFLDADNWLHEGHVELMLRIGAPRPDCRALVASRTIVTHDTGEPIEDHPPDQSGLVHHGPGGPVQPFVDANCIWLQGDGVPLGRDWVTAMRFPEDGDGYNVDAPISVVEDRLFWGHVCRCLRHSGFPVPVAPVPTVFYRSAWIDSYNAANPHQRPPRVAKAIDAEGNLLKLHWRVIDDGKGPRFDAWQVGMEPPPLPDGARLVDEAS